MRENYNQEKDIKQKQLHLRNYKLKLEEALPHLEKAYACDPYEQLFDTIKTIYITLKKAEGISTLDERIKNLSQKCIDVLKGY